MMVFGFPYISAWEHQIFKILVFILHNEGVIMGGRHNNVEDQMLFGRDIRKTKYHHLKLLRFYEMLCNLP